MKINERLISLFLRHPNDFINSISCSYPFTIEQLGKYKDVLKWNVINNDDESQIGLSWNPNLKWSAKLVDEFIDLWNWTFISGYIIGESLWFNGILKKYDKKLDWFDVSHNLGIPWNEKLMEKYQHKLDWPTLSSNTAIPWSKKMVNKYENKIDFFRFANNSSAPWANSRNWKTKEARSILRVQESIVLIEKYESKLEWSHLFFDWTNGLKRIESDYIIDETIRQMRKLPKVNRTKIKK